MVCDRGYLRHQKAWRAELARRAPGAVVEVEGDVVVPLEVASGRAETSARTLRPSLQRVWDEYLRALEDAAVQKSALDLRFEGVVDLSDLEGVLGSLQLDRSGVPVESMIRGVTAEACPRLGELVTPLARS